jgi:hypothetical protein
MSDRQEFLFYCCPTSVFVSSYGQIFSGVPFLGLLFHTWPQVRALLEAFRVSSFLHNFPIAEGYHSVYFNCKCESATFSYKQQSRHIQRPSPQFMKFLFIIPFQLKPHPAKNFSSVFSSFSFSCTVLSNHSSISIF